MPNQDPRCIAGASVQTKASKVTSEPECQRLFGSAWKDKVVVGRVCEVLRQKVNNRNQTSLDVLWQVGIRQKRKTLKLVNVKHGHSLLQDGRIPDRELEPDYPFEDDNCLDGAPVDRSNPACTANTPAEQDSRGAPESTAAGVSRPAEATTQRAASVPRPEEEVIESHGYKWKHAPVSLPLNGPVQLRDWNVKLPDGDTIRPGSDQENRDFIEYFYAMFPMGYLSKMVAMTNRGLRSCGKKPTDSGELLRFFGVLLLITRFEFNARADLWKTEPISDYIPAPSLGKAMSRNRFDLLRRHVCFSLKPETRGDLSSVRYRWMEVTGFVDAINKHRTRYVQPSESICIDESMVRWYGKGGHWLNDGLPHYVAIDRKPENGCEIQNAACGKSGIMLRLEIVSTKDDESGRDFEDQGSHGTAVLKRLLEPWFGTGRVVCADSYFGSVESAKSLWDVGLRFIGSIKTATRGFPWVHLTHREMIGRGDWTTMICEKSPGHPDMMAVAWVDRNRHYFVSTVSNALPGTDMTRMRYREENSDEAGDMVQIVVSRPQALEWYYDVCSQVDRHNRCRQDDIALEKKFEVKDWAMRVNSGLLSMCFVDAWLLYKGGMGSRAHCSIYNFMVSLSTSLINNMYETYGLRSDSTPAGSSDGGITTPSVRSGRMEHLTPTKELRRTRDGRFTKSLKQMNCRVCKKRKSTHVCSRCADQGKQNTFICHTKSSRDCFVQHMEFEHGLGFFRQPQFS